jgi:hypothetical protein
MVCTDSVLFNKGLSNEPNFSQTHLGGQYTFKYLSEIHNNNMLENHLLLLAGPSHVTVSLSGDNCMKIKDIPGGVKEGFLLPFPEAAISPQKGNNKER